MRLPHRLPWILGVATGVTLLDQLTKAWVQASIPLWGVGPRLVPGFFQIVHSQNRGAAFGFLNRWDVSWQQPLFVLITLAAIVFLGVLAQSKDNRGWLYPLGLGAILGGAIGNLIDRLRFGAVVDFLDVYVGDWHWPAFNVADSAICVGVGLLLIAQWQSPCTQSSST
jgi:signal peptidase II